MEPTFREAADGDIETILSFMRLLYDQDGLTFDEPAARAALAGIVGDRSIGRVWMIDEGPEAIGYMVLTLGYSLMYRGRDAFVDELFIRADRRRRGIGRKAMEIMEQACRDLEVRAIHLEVERPNAAAQSLYRTFGFVDHDQYLMTKRIGTP
jgi:ribosomal protein S18 acetylase RimI-like enzyme